MHDGTADVVQRARMGRKERAYIFAADPGDPDQTPRAYIAIRDEGRHLAEVSALQTRPDYRRRGLASALLQVAAALENQDRALMVRPDPMADKAVSRADLEKLYATYGYVTDPELPEGYMMSWPAQAAGASKAAALGLTARPLYRTPYRQEPTMTHPQAPWFDGVFRVAAARGFDPASAEKLAMVAVYADLCERSPEFAEGFNRQWEKLAQQAPVSLYEPTAIPDILPEGGEEPLSGRAARSPEAVQRHAPRAALNGSSDGLFTTKYNKDRQQQKADADFRRRLEGAVGQLGSNSPLNEQARQAAAGHVVRLVQQNPDAFGRVAADLSPEVLGQAFGGMDQSTRSRMLEYVKPAQRRQIVDQLPAAARAEQIAAAQQQLTVRHGALLAGGMPNSAQLVEMARTMPPELLPSNALGEGGVPNAIATGQWLSRGGGLQQLADPEWAQQLEQQRAREAPNDWSTFAGMDERGREDWMTSRADLVQQDAQKQRWRDQVTEAQKAGPLPPDQARLALDTLGMPMGYEQFAQYDPQAQEDMLGQHGDTLRGHWTQNPISSQAALGMDPAQALAYLDRTGQRDSMHPDRLAHLTRESEAAQAAKAHADVQRHQQALDAATAQRAQAQAQARNQASQDAYFAGQRETGALPPVPEAPAQLPQRYYRPGRTQQAVNRMTAPLPGAEPGAMSLPRATPVQPAQPAAAGGPPKLSQPLDSVAATGGPRRKPGPPKPAAPPAVAQPAKPAAPAEPPKPAEPAKPAQPTALT
jgi:GNAT superfamily N-acetyltransferase